MAVGSDHPALQRGQIEEAFRRQVWLPCGGYIVIDETEAMIAIGSGGFFGVGLGESVQKIFYLPEAHTDFILAIIGEELGVAGVTAVLFLYGLLAYAGLRVAKAAKGAYAKLLAAGITSLILSQACLNVFAVLGLAPRTTYRYTVRAVDTTGNTGAPSPEAVAEPL